ncbi:hypothetical protein ACFOMD_18075 [Sphingoaurantiacus capsulatus]|uniref:Lipoprotein n=1 Tax=Sphingoaurantiacus capsulatus TaxID=1771310 RepID=A0ABV7XE59_9SPHN
MIRVAPLLLSATLLAGCAATADGEWPSLARRPGEIEAGTRGPAPEPAAPAAVVTPPEAPADDSAVNEAAARIADISKEFTDVEARWQKQRVETETALTGAERAAPNTPAWSKAQLELTRLERLGATIGELRDRANVVAGDLAQASARGSDVKAPLDSAGTLIGRIEAARAAHLTLFESTQRALAR